MLLCNLVSLLWIANLVDDCIVSEGKMLDISSSPSSEFPSSRAISRAWDLWPSLAPVLRVTASEMVQRSLRVRAKDRESS